MGERTRRDFIRAAAGALLASATGCAGRPRSSAAAKDYVVTVRGPIAAEDLGFTLPHEHLFSNMSDPSRSLTDPEAAVRELALYSAAGGRSLVILTPIGPSRNPTALRSISERTGLNIVMATGFFKHESMPAGTHDRSVEDMTAQFVREIEVGVDGTGIRAGIIGEIGLSSARQGPHGRTAAEECVLRAAARAHKVTGVGINVHFDIPANPAEHESAIDILEGEGADLRRVALSHFLPDPAKVEHFRRLAKRGCFVEFDLFGLEGIIRRPLPPAEDVKLEVVRDLVAEGLAPHLLMSQDICFKQCLVENGGKGYAHLLRNVLPKLERLGVDPAALRTITVENPRRLLAIRKT